MIGRTSGPKKPYSTHPQRLCSRTRTDGEGGPQGELADPGLPEKTAINRSSSNSRSSVK